MKKKKNKRLLTMLASLSLLIAACGGGSKKTTPSQEDARYHIYELAVASGEFTGTYEEWLNTIKGVGIESIRKTAVNGNVDIYTITYTNGQTSTFSVTNGREGERGIQGNPGKDGHTPEITISSDGYWVIDGTKTDIKAQGPKGDPGIGIVEIRKTATDGLVDTYTIYYSDGNTSTFTVTNGETISGGGSSVSISEDGYWVIDGVKTEFKATGTQGEPGEPGRGIVSIEKTSTDGLVDTYTITYTDGTTSTFTVTNGKDGEDISGGDGSVVEISDDGYWVIDGVKTDFKAEGTRGEDGRGILSVAKTGSEDGVDTYTITYTDGTTSTFTVTNGKDGQSIQGEKGEDGHTPVITISDDGYWVIDGVKTESIAQGPKGDQGDPGRGVVSIRKTGTDGNIDTYTIFYSDGTTSTFTVTNGAIGETGEKGEPGADGHSPVITISDDGYWVIDGIKTEVMATGVQGPKGDQGDPGRGIVSITKTSTEGNVDTYTILYSDGTTSTFTVTNGQDGQDGEITFSGAVSVSDDGYWVIDGVKTDIKAEGPQGPKGDTGEAGVGITSITKTGTEGNVDTYTILYSDGTTSTFTVTNGTIGADGEKGEPGEDGHTPVITISEDGYWVIDGVKTEVKAQGVQGPQGEPGQDGKSAYELYCESHPDYQGDEAQWLDDLVNGRLGDKEYVTVTFDTGSGGSVIEPQILEKGDHVTKPEDPTRPGYEFVRWTYQGEPWVFYGYSVVEDITLTAEWNALEYTATFLNDDGSVLDYQEGLHYGDVITYGGEAPAAQNVEERYTYTFTGWNPAELVVTGNMTFTAQYSREYTPFEVHYLDAEGNVLYSAQSHEDGVVPSYVGDTPTKATDEDYQYEFAGWQEEGSTEDLRIFVPYFNKCTTGLQFNESTVTGYIGTKTIVTIPSRWNGYDITSVANNAFYNNTTVEQITVPSSVLTIGSYSFANMTSLTWVQLSANLTSIGSYAFRGCSALTSLVVPESVLTVGPAAFESMNANFLLLAKVEVEPEGWEGDYTNWHKADNGRKVIWGYRGGTYKNGYSYVLYTIGGHDYACVVRVDASKTTFEPLEQVEGFVVNEVDWRIFKNDTFKSNMTYIELPEGITEIPNNTFYQYTALEHIVLPSTLTTIGSYAFERCSSLVDIVIPASVATVGAGAFNYVSSSFIMYAETESKPQGWNGDYVNHWKVSGGFKVIWGYKETVTEDGYTYALYEIDGHKYATVIRADADLTEFVPLQSVNGYVVNDVDWRIFKQANYKTNMTRIVLPEGINEIPNNTFYQYTALEHIVLPSTLETIDAYAFERCASLVDIVIPASVTTVGAGAFDYVSSSFIMYAEAEEEPAGWEGDYVNHWKVSGGFKVIWGYKETIVNGNYTYALYEIGGNKYASVIYADAALTQFTPLKTINNYSVNDVDWRIFNKAEFKTNMTYVELPEGITAVPRIGSINGFNQYTALEHIVLPSTLETIDAYAFERCASLVDIVIPASVTTVGAGAFDYVSSSFIMYAEAEEEPAGWEGDYTNYYQQGGFMVYWGYVAKDTTDGVTYRLFEVNGVRTAFVVGYDDSMTSFNPGNSITYQGQTYNIVKIYKDVFASDTSKSTLQSFVCPTYVEVVEAELLMNHTALISVELRCDSLTTIGDRAFYGCSSLAAVHIGSTVTTVGNQAFANIATTCEIYIHGIASKPNGWNQYWTDLDGSTIHWNY